mgnify:CR=1 FL=1
MIYIVLSFMLAGAFMNFKYIEKEDHKGKIKAKGEKSFALFLLTAIQMR